MQLPMQQIITIGVLAASTAQLLRTLYQAHGGPGPWLDDIENKLIKGAKGSSADVTNEGVEAAGIRDALTILQDLIAKTRDGRIAE